MGNNILYIADIRSNNNGGKSTGHFLPVAAMYQKLFADWCEVKVAGGPVYLTKFHKDEMCLLPYDVSTTDVKGKWHTMKNAIKLFKEAKGQTIVLQQGTVITSFIAIALFYKKTSKLFSIQYSDEGVRTPFRRLIYRFARHKIDGIICPNEEVGRAYGRPYCVVPDYIKMTSPNESLPFEERQYDFCMVGTIWPDKGVVEVARHLKESEFKLIVAGSVPNSVRYLGEELERIASENSNIKLVLDYISEEEYVNIIKHSKYCILNYQGCYNDRSSGVVLDVLFNGTPIVGSRCGALNLVEKFGVGYMYNNIECWDPQSILHEDIYNKYQSAIKDFFYKQRNYAARLRQFVLN